VPRERPADLRLAPGLTLDALGIPDADPDRLLTDPACVVVKLQRKVLVGRIGTPVGTVWVKRYNVFAPRVALAGAFTRSPAARAWDAAARLAALGFATAEPLVAVEFRRAGLRMRSFLVTRHVAGAVPADARWAAHAAERDPRRRRAARAALAAALGDLFRRLHAAGVYHPDLKDANILVTGDAERPACVLLDLEAVRFGPVGARRRVKNVVQLARTLGRRVGPADRLRFLRAYLGPAPRDAVAAFGRAVATAAARKDRGRAAVPAGPAPSVSATVICQDEEARIARCLESVAWCDEIVVVDGGSHDGTVGIARRFTDNVLVHAWPGHRAQKQFALDAATGEWVLNVDADECVTADLAVEVRAALRGVPPDVHGFAVPRLVCYLGRWWWRGPLGPRRVVRLVRRRATVWGGRDPHERAEVAGRIERLASPLLHYTYADVADHLRSVNALTTVAAARPNGAAGIGVGRLVVEPAWRFLRGWVVHQGFRDGFPGLFVCVTAAFYTWLRWAKAWERRRTGAP